MNISLSLPSLLALATIQGAKGGDILEEFQFGVVPFTFCSAQGGRLTRPHDIGPGRPPVLMRLRPPYNRATAGSPYIERNTHHSVFVFRESRGNQGTVECICDSDSTRETLILVCV